MPSLSTDTLLKYRLGASFCMISSNSMSLAVKESRSFGRLLRCQNDERGKMQHNWINLYIAFRLADASWTDTYNIFPFSRPSISFRIAQVNCLRSLTCNLTRIKSIMSHGKGIRYTCCITNSWQLTTFRIPFISSFHWTISFTHQGMKKMHSALCFHLIQKKIEVLSWCNSSDKKNAKSHNQRWQL